MKKQKKKFHPWHKPYPPLKPSENIIKERKTITLINSAYFSLKDIQTKVDELVSKENVDPETISFSVDTSLGYYDTMEVNVEMHYYFEGPDPKFDQKMAEYKIAYEKYKKEKAQYKINLIEYNKKEEQQFAKNKLKQLERLKAEEDKLRKLANS